eukprot:scaffold91669_cov36-Cyclotella_meneghiniana.AAC.1
MDRRGIFSPIMLPACTALISCYSQHLLADLQLRGRIITSHDPIAHASLAAFYNRALRSRVKLLHLSTALVRVYGWHSCFIATTFPAADLIGCFGPFQLPSQRCCLSTRHCTASSLRTHPNASHTNDIHSTNTSSIFKYPTIVHPYNGAAAYYSQLLLGLDLFCFPIVCVQLMVADCNPNDDASAKLNHLAVASWRCRPRVLAFFKASCFDYDCDSQLLIHNSKIALYFVDTTVP